MRQGIIGGSSDINNKHAHDNSESVARSSSCSRLSPHQPTGRLCPTMEKRGLADTPGNPPPKLRRQLLHATSEGGGAYGNAAFTPTTRTLRAIECYKKKYGHSPSQKSKDLDERRLAIKYSKVPRHRKESKVEETLHACVAFLEANGSAPQFTRVPARADEDRLAQRLKRVRQMSTETFTPEMNKQLERLLAAQKQLSLQGNTGAQKKQAAGAIRQDEYKQWCSNHNEPMVCSVRLQHHSAYVTCR